MNATFAEWRCDLPATEFLMTGMTPTTPPHSILTTKQ
jgi:hypothetical protein